MGVIRRAPGPESGRELAQFVQDHPHLDIAGDALKDKGLSNDQQELYRASHGRVFKSSVISCCCEEWVRWDSGCSVGECPADWWVSLLFVLGLSQSGDLRYARRQRVFGWGGGIEMVCASCFCLVTHCLRGVLFALCRLAAPI